MPDIYTKHTYKLKSGKENNISNNLPLLQGEPIVVLGNDGKVRLKIGDGVRPYGQLNYIGGESGACTPQIFPLTIPFDEDPLSALDDLVHSTSVLEGAIACLRKRIETSDIDTYIYSSYIYKENTWIVLTPFDQIITLSEEDEISGEIITTSYQISQDSNGILILKRIITDPVISSDIQDNSVTTEKIADGSVNTNKLIDNSVTTDKINNKSVSTDKTTFWEDVYSEKNIVDNNSSLWDDGKVINGNINTGYSGYKTSYYISVLPNSNYCISLRNTSITLNDGYFMDSSIAFYTSDKDTIKYANSSNSENVFMGSTDRKPYVDNGVCYYRIYTPDSAAYIRFSLKNIAYLSSPYQLQLEFRNVGSFDSISPTAFEEYYHVKRLSTEENGIPLEVPIPDNSITTSKLANKVINTDKIADKAVTTDKEAFWEDVYSENLYKPYNYTDGLLDRGIPSTAGSGGNYFTTDYLYLPDELSEYYALILYDATTAATNRIAFYDSNKVFISQSGADLINGSTLSPQISYSYRIVSLPTNARYARVSFSNTYKESKNKGFITVENSETPPPNNFVPYSHVKRIKGLDIDNVPLDVLNSEDIIDNLNSDADDKALSAKQGKLLSQILPKNKLTATVKVETGSTYSEELFITTSSYLNDDPNKIIKICGNNSRDNRNINIFSGSTISVDGVVKSVASADDSTPLRVNNVLYGGNHSYSLIQITEINTNYIVPDNIGKKFTYIVGTNTPMEAYLVSVRGKVGKFLPQYYIGTTGNVNGCWLVKSTAVPNSNSLMFENNLVEFDRSDTNNNRSIVNAFCCTKSNSRLIKFYTDDNKAVESSELQVGDIRNYSCNKFDIVEHYDIVSYASLYDYYDTNYNNQTYITETIDEVVNEDEVVLSLAVDNVYTILPDGVCITNTTYQVLEDHLYLSDCGIMQRGAIGGYSEGTIKYYLNNATQMNYVSGGIVQATRDMTRPKTASEIKGEYTGSFDWQVNSVDANKYCNRMVVQEFDSNNILMSGVVFGYFPDISYSNNSTRFPNGITNRRVWNIRNDSLKSYPVAIYTTPFIKDDVVTCTCYRKFFGSENSKITNYSIIPYNNSYYIFIDMNSDTNNKMYELDLPAECINKQVEVLENTNLEFPNMIENIKNVTGEKLYIKLVDNTVGASDYYGCATLKLT